MIKVNTFQTLLSKGIKVKHCKRIKMRTQVYLLTIKWQYMKNEIGMDVLIVFQDFDISISIDSIKGHYYYTEHFRKEISEIIHSIVKDISMIPEYRFHFFYKKIRLNISPRYIIQNIDKYQKRIDSDTYIEEEVEKMIKKTNDEMKTVQLPPYKFTDVYFQRIILYGYDGIKLSNILEEKELIRKSYTRSIAFPNAVCEFNWRGIEFAKHNREEELIKIWYRYLKQFEFSCEIIINE